MLPWGHWRIGNNREGTLSVFLMTYIYYAHLTSVRFYIHIYIIIVVRSSSIVPLLVCPLLILGECLNFCTIIYIVHRAFERFF